MGSYDWTMGIRRKNFDAEFRWRERSYGGEYLGYEASVVSPTGEDISSMLPEWKKEAIFRAASTLRRAELESSTARVCSCGPTIRRQRPSPAKGVAREGCADDQS